MNLDTVSIRKKARDILGVPEEADENTIRRAYRDLAKKYHPDRDPDDSGLADRFKLIAEAYEVLCGGKNAGRYAILKADSDSVNGSPVGSSLNGTAYWEWWMERFGNL